MSQCRHCRYTSPHPLAGHYLVLVSRLLTQAHDVRPVALAHHSCPERQAKQDQMIYEWFLRTQTMSYETCSLNWPWPANVHIFSGHHTGQLSSSALRHMDIFGGFSDPEVAWNGGEYYKHTAETENSKCVALIHLLEREAHLKPWAGFGVLQTSWHPWWCRYRDLNRLTSAG